MLDSLKSLLSGDTAFEQMVSEQAAAVTGSANKEAMLQELAGSGDPPQQFAAMAEAAYIIAIADGKVTDTERTKIIEGLAGLTEGRIGQSELGAMLDGAQARFEQSGKEARLAAVASRLKEPAARRTAFIVASAAAWLGGVDVKEGLALQELARKLGIETTEMHKLMAKAHG